MKANRRLVLPALLAAASVAGLMLWRRRVQGEFAEWSGAPKRRPPTGRQPSGPLGNAQVLGPPSEPAILQALAAWVPEAPRSPFARMLVYLWAAPLSLAGTLVGLTSGTRPVMRDGVVLFPGIGGVVAWLLRARGFQATAWGHVVLVRGVPSPSLLAHEMVHVRQAERFGPLFPPLYGVLWLAYGYARHPLERAARLGGRRTDPQETNG